MENSHMIWNYNLPLPYLNALRPKCNKRQCIGYIKISICKYLGTFLEYFHCNTNGDHLKTFETLIYTPYFQYDKIPLTNREKDYKKLCR